MLADNFWENCGHFKQLFFGSLYPSMATSLQYQSTINLVLLNLPNGLEKMPQSGVGSMQGSNEDCLPMKGHTWEGDAPTVLQGFPMHGRANLV